MQILANEISNSAMFRSGDFIKKSLKIPKGQSESAYQRRTDNTMAKRKKYKKTKNNLQNITIKTEGQVTQSPLKPGVNSGAPEG